MDKSVSVNDVLRGRSTWNCEGKARFTDEEIIEGLRVLRLRGELDTVPWHSIKWSMFTEDLILEFKSDQAFLYFAGMYLEFSEEFILANKDIWNWQGLCSHQKLSAKVILELQDRLGPYYKRLLLHNGKIDRAELVKLPDSFWGKGLEGVHTRASLRRIGACPSGLGNFSAHTEEGVERTWGWLLEHHQCGADLRWLHQQLALERDENNDD